MTAYTLGVRSEHEDSLHRKRCLLPQPTIEKLGLRTGEVIAITPVDATRPIVLCVAWPWTRDVDPSGISLSYFSAKALKCDRVQVWKNPNSQWHKHLTHTRHITLKALEPLPVSIEKRAEWLKLLARETTIDLKYVIQGQVVTVPFEGHPRLFQLEFEQDKAHPEKLAQNISGLSITDRVEWANVIQSAAEVDWDTQVDIDDEHETKPPIIAHVGSPYSTVGGLDKQIAVVRDLIEIPLTNPGLFHQFGLKPPKGILLYGPPGTGKTHLARAIARSTNASLVAVSGAELASAYHGETEARLRAVFAEARKQSPCIIVLDEVDAMCPQREEGGGVEARTVATLLTELDGIDTADHGGNAHEQRRQPRIVVVATTNRPNAIDPALRRPGRFDREIEIGIPDASARLQILSVLLRDTPHELTGPELESLAGRTHGYVGADLSAVVRDAGTRAIKRTLASGSVVPSPIGATDLSHALLTIRPSGLRSLALETPTTRWADVGGQADVKARLRESVEWPLRHPEAFKRLGVRPPAGVLMYGPPGCSKTLIARALATESGVNFLSVKGPELLNKYVGESERAVREMFTKARGAAPSIIFFDEVDALATARDTDSGRAHEGILTSLLTEMDGVQELVGVTVVAATNRPDVLVSAHVLALEEDSQPRKHLPLARRRDLFDYTPERLMIAIISIINDKKMLPLISTISGADGFRGSIIERGLGCDSALMRPGRLDKLLYVGPPDLAGRKEILAIRTKKMSVDPELDLDVLAELTEGCSGAEIAALCQDAALGTMRQDMDAEYVRRADFEAAARGIQRQITHEMVRSYEAFGQQNRG
ncbi:AAA domain (dynein-related subfamily) [Rhizoctonia solani]|uniref:AAA domain (Dynein-related subfamily) n=1 Tax=Rhizoctonia solani TaxID=456999 RepID=A0A8H7LHM3_9AGAM|nr:AAA domain (dynein-related subfamily) [Rhizoctonia solani]